MPELRLTGRKVAVVGLSAAAATAALVAVAGPAAAAPPTSQQTTCTDNVRVRSQPNLTAPVIGNCKAGEQVTVDETRNGFAHLVNKQGWSSMDHVDLKGKKLSRDGRDKPGEGVDENGDPEAPEEKDGGLLGGLGGGLG